ncbi:MAG: WD40/YVTN/BNR-like repeat-containing protein, partial [Acidimicrobiia bacterium]
MSEVRLLVGTRKGGFVLTADAGRKSWEISGPHFGGWEVFHIQASPSDPDRMYAALWTAWHGAVIQHSKDRGLTWEPVGNQFSYADDQAMHQGWEGEQKPWELKRAWHLEPSPEGAEVVYAGVEDAALFRSPDGGLTWQELPGLRRHPSGSEWQPGAGGMCLHTIVFDPEDTERMYVAISAAGVFRTDDSGQSWKAANRGLRAEYTPEPEPEAGYCVHKVALHPDRPGTLFLQKHYGVYRSDDHADSWTSISGNLPVDFGFPVTVHPHDPETIYVVPIQSDNEHYPPEGALRVWRSRKADGDWEPLTKGLPDRDCYVNVLRDAMATDRLDPGGVYFGTTGGQVYSSADSGTRGRRRRWPC